MASANQLESLKFKNYAENMLKIIYIEHYKKQQLCDILLKTKDNGFGIGAHLIILSTASGFFSDYISQYTGKCIELTLEDIKHEDLATLIDFCYTGILEYHDDALEDILNTASSLKMESVIEECCSALLDKLGVDNCLRLLSIFYKYNCEDELRKAVAVACTNFMKLSQTDEYLKLTLGEMTRLIESDDLVVTSEEFVVNKILEWINYDPIHREVHITQFMYCIRHPFLTPAFILEHIQPICGMSKDNLKLLTCTLNWHHLPATRSSLTWICTKPRQYLLNDSSKMKSEMDQSNDNKSSLACESKAGSASDRELILALGGTGHEKNAKFIEIYSPHSNKWHLCESHPEDIEYIHCYGIALMEENVILAGGKANFHLDRNRDTVYSLNLRTMSWSGMPNMQTARGHFAMAALSNSLYAIGGSADNDDRILSSVERWNAASNKWTYISALNVARRRFGCVVLNNGIYVVGGNNGINVLPSMEYYDAAHERWIMKTPMHTKRQNAAVGVYKEQIYVFGGFDGERTLNSAERYDTSKDEWTEIASMSVKRGAFGCVLLNGNFILMGGKSIGDTRLDSVEKYDPETNKYSEMTPMRYGRRFFDAIKVPDIIPEKTYKK